LVRAALDEQLWLALDMGFPAVLVHTATRALLVERPTTRAQDSAVASSLAAQAYLGRTWAFSADIDRAIGAVGVEQANAALRKYLKPADLATFLVGDFAKK
jgi:zinc protease